MVLGWGSTAAAYVGAAMGSIRMEAKNAGDEITRLGLSKNKGLNRGNGLMNRACA